MGFYRDAVVPHLIRLAMRNRQLVPYRERVVGAAEGRVLEIGIGAAANLPFMPPAVDEVIGLEPARRLVAMAGRAAMEAALPVRLVEGSAEAIPLDDRSVDTVLTTWTMCSIPDPVAALNEMRRVLKPGGRLLFVEHGRSPDAGVRRWQNRLNPIWRPVAGGCNINRPIRDLIADNGFAITGIETGYAKGPKPMTFMYEGQAVPA